MRINNNIQALNAYRNLSSNQFNTSKNLERLSSGLRINRAADDAAGLAISEKMRAQIRGLQMAERNSLDGISLIQTAEGALTEVHSMLHRMRELAVQAANDTNTEGDRKEIQKEIDQLTSEINRIGNATEFNTKKILNGGATKIAPTVDKYGVAKATGEFKLATVTESKLPTPTTPIGAISAVSEVTPSKTEQLAEYTLTVGNITGGSGDTLTLDFKGDGSDVITLTEGPDFTGSADADLDGDAVAVALNNDPAFSANWQATGNSDGTITIKAKTGQSYAGALGNDLTVTGASLSPVTTGVTKQQGEYGLTISQPFGEGDQVTVNGKVYTFKAGGTGATEIDITTNNTEGLQAAVLLSKIEANDPRFSGGSALGPVITLKEDATGIAGSILADPTVTNIIPEQLGEYTVELTKMFVEGEQIEVAGQKYTFVKSGATGNQINIGNTESEQAANIKAAIETPLSTTYTVGVVDNKLSFKEKVGQAMGAEPVLDRVGNAQGTVHFNQISPTEYEIDITNAFRENETIQIGNITFKGVLGTANPLANPPEFSVDGNARDQANSLKQAISANTLLAGSTFNTSIAGTKITLTRATGTGTLTKPETDLTAAIPGQFSFTIERSIVGQSYTIDGVEIKVVNDSTKFNDDVNTGKALRYSKVLSEQADNLRKAIERNPELGKKYFVSGTGNEIKLEQRPGFESAVLPNIMLSNTGDGDTFKSNLQIGPNQHQVLTVELHDIRSPMLGIATTDPRTEIRDINGDLIEGAAFNVIKNVSNGLSEGFVEFSIDVTSHEKASAAIKVFDTAIERVNGERASLGALQNRLEHTINNLKVTHENLSSSESRIRDADMALEMTAFTKNNILNQSAQAMLAQANQLPQGVLQLLQG